MRRMRRRGRTRGDHQENQQGRGEGVAVEREPPPLKRRRLRRLVRLGHEQRCQEMRWRELKHFKADMMKPSFLFLLSIDFSLRGLAID